MNSSTNSKGLTVVANFNQIKEIEAFLTLLLKHWPKEDILVVDDGSSDGSDQVSKKLGIPLLRHPKNIGTGASIRSGIRYAQSKGYEYVLISAANGKMRPDEFSRLAAPIIQGQADYVVGNRYMNGGGSPGLTPFRRMAIPLFSFLSSLLLGKFFSDMTCGLRAYRLSIFKDPRMQIDQAWLDRYELEYYIQYWAVRQSETRIVQVPVTMKYDHLESGRKSKIKPIQGWWLMFRPFLFLALRIKK